MKTDHKARFLWAFLALVFGIGCGAWGFREGVLMAEPCYCAYDAREVVHAFRLGNELCQLGITIDHQTGEVRDLGDGGEP